MRYCVAAELEEAPTIWYLVQIKSCFNELIYRQRASETVLLFGAEHVSIFATDR